MGQGAHSNPETEDLAAPASEGDEPLAQLARVLKTTGGLRRKRSGPGLQPGLRID